MHGWDDKVVQHWVCWHGIAEDLRHHQCRLHHLMLRWARVACPTAQGHAQCLYHQIYQPHVGLIAEWHRWNEFHPWSKVTNKVEAGVNIEGVVPMYVSRQDLIHGVRDCHV